MLLINTLPRMALQNLTRISSVQCQALFHRNQRMKEVLPNMSAFFLQRPAFREHSRHSNIASFLSFLKDDVLCPLCGGIRDSCGDRAAGCRVLGTGYHDARSPTFFVQVARRRVHQFGGFWLVGSLGLHCRPARYAALTLHHTAHHSTHVH